MRRARPTPGGGRARARPGLLGTVLPVSWLLAAPAAGHVLCGINATLETQPRLVGDGAAVAFYVEFCDFTGQDGGSVESVELPMDPLHVVPSSGAWVDCPTGGCLSDPDGSLRIPSFQLHANECIRFRLRFQLQPGLRGRELCERGAVRVRVAGSSVPCDRYTDDPTLISPEPTCYQVEDLAPACTLAPTITPDFYSGCAGVAAMLTASAAASGCPGGSLAYQWLKDGLALPGAGSATLTIPASEPPSGASYRCLVSCAGESACRDLADPVLVVLLGPGEILAPDAACAGSPVLVSVPGGAVCSIECGDGSPPSPACVASCSYGSPGSYRIRATSIDGGGCSATAERPIEALDSATPCIATRGAFCELPADGPTHLRLASCSPPGLALDWSASLGTLDDSHATGPWLSLPDVTVPTDVLLTLDATAAGCPAGGRTTSTLTLLPSPFARFTIDPNPGCVGAAIGFAPLGHGTPGPFAYTWDFGDGTPPSRDPVATHAYGSFGSYTATLTVTDLGTGCATTTPGTVFVSEACCAQGLPAVSALLGVKGPGSDDLSFGWNPLAAASGGFDVWSADRKDRIPQARAPGGPGLSLVCDRAPGPACTHAGGLPATAGSPLFYQVRGVCGGLEGP